MRKQRREEREAGFWFFFSFWVFFLFGEEGLRLEESVLGGSGEVD